jgi:hypothetical protein
MAERRSASLCAVLRPLAGVLLSLVLAASGCGDSVESSPEVDRLVDAIGSGGPDRSRAVDRLAGLLNQGGVRADPNRVDNALEAVLAELEPLIGSGPPTCDSWANDEDYLERQFAAELLVDVAGHSDADAAVRRALGVRDPYLAAWAVKAARRAGLSVGERVLDRAAADDYGRSVLIGPDDEGWQERVPLPHRTLEARARADMVQWLAYPTEYGCQPSELEVMERFDEQEGTYFVFRFRAGGPNAADDDGRVFHAGVAGPFDDEGHLAATSSTFSEFEPAAARTPREHLSSLVELVEDAQDE